MTATADVLIIIKAADIPAIRYYVGLFVVVHFLALRFGMRPVARAELPSWRPVLMVVRTLAPKVVGLALCGAIVGDGAWRRSAPAPVTAR
jgi:TRAP-type uncharacterized transport system fused permease subunit